MRTSSVVFLVDDDAEIRRSTTLLLGNAGLIVRSFSSPAEFLSQYDASVAGVLLLDYQMPEMSGMELYSLLRSKGSNHPFILVTGRGTVRTAVEAMRLGALDVLEKPFDPEFLISIVRRGIGLDLRRRRAAVQAVSVDKKMRELTTREREILQMVVAGMLTKQIAKKLDISPKTVEVHRSNITKKMAVSSVAQLVKQVTLHSLLQDQQRSTAETTLQTPACPISIALSTTAWPSSEPTG